MLYKGYCAVKSIACIYKVLLAFMIKQYDTIRMIAFNIKNTALTNYYLLIACSNKNHTFQLKCKPAIRTVGPGLNIRYIGIELACKFNVPMKVFTPSFRGGDKKSRPVYACSLVEKAILFVFC